VAFRDASPFVDLPANVQINLGVAPGNSTSSGDVIASFPVTLMANETYVVVADGIISPTGYDPAPPFNLEIYDMGRESATDPNNTDVLVHHGSTDAPTVDVVETGVGAGTIVDDISYSEFAGYLELPTVDYILDVTDETGTVTVARYQAPLATLALDGAALVVVASGFLDPSNNSDGEPFGLYVALPSGGEMIPLPLLLSTPDFGSNDVVVYPNPSSDLVNIKGLDETDYTIQLIDLQGRIVSDKFSAAENPTINISDLANGIYQMLISDSNGILGSKRIIKE
ncbi:MAG: T9SS type A sorting domain-containing protein, partial [Bacteroidia bacterium]|nr:T9SS type A sorting domain-containing protein [Bacteroidia bacterium]